MRAEREREGENQGIVKSFEANAPSRGRRRKLKLKNTVNRQELRGLEYVDRG